MFIITEISSIMHSIHSVITALSSSLHFRLAFQG
jgi:hypothetical protein